MRILIASFFMFLLGSSLLSGWDGYNYEEGEYIEIDKRNLVRRYNDVEVYHWGDGSYHEEEVQGYSGNDLETYDYETNEFHHYEMD